VQLCLPMRRGDPHGVGAFRRGSKAHVVSKARHRHVGARNPHLEQYACMSAGRQVDMCCTYAFMFKLVSTDRQACPKIQFGHPSF
jgi:hypothetical protein